MNGFRIPTLGRPVEATIEVPGSKSVSNRALVCAALADGESALAHVAPGDDTTAMIECLGRLGIAVERGETTAVVWGTGGRLRPGPTSLPARLAGTTSRFVTALAALGPGPYVVDGDPPLRARPMAPLHDALAALGVEVTSTEAAGRLPVRVSGAARGGRVVVRADISSQYLTALMLIAPRLSEPLVIEIDGTLISRPYVELTASVMEDFGVEGVEVGDERITVPTSRYVPREYDIEPDASSASYPLALAAMLGGSVEVPRLTAACRQGDARFADVVGEMGCRVVVDDTGTIVSRDASVELRGVDVDMADISDLVPTVAVLAAVASTPSRIRGVGFIRHKESDRLGDLADELNRLGARITVTDDGLDVQPVPVGSLSGTVVRTHHDHRLAMAFGVLGAAVPGIELDDATVVTKSWPGFWDDLAVMTEAGR